MRHRTLATHRTDHRARWRLVALAVAVALGLAAWAAAHAAPPRDYPVTADNTSAPERSSWG
jgi:hypothetical protein